jgi:dihydrolipoamide dehydrogenase
MRTNTTLAAAIEDSDRVTVTLDGGDSLIADVLLVAVGRTPRTVGFSERGIAVQRGFVITDDQLRSSLPSVYAVGDIVQGLQLAHRGFQHGIFVAEHIAGLNSVPPDDELVPRVVCSSPEAPRSG